MSFLTALLAFSAIMIVLTTLATVVVEGLHKLMRKRASDFEQLLTQLYKDAVEPRLANAGVQVGATADQFVQDLMKNPAFDVSKKGRLAKLPLLKNLFDSSFQELTTRQFVEQFAQTEAGRKLKGEADDVVKDLIGKFSYEFERYGEAASNYFRRRATTLSVIVAFILAVGLNIDAFRLYGALAEDETLAEQVIASVDVNQLETAYQARIANAANPDEAEKAKNEYKQVLQDIKEESENLRALGLPIGFEYFPYCEARSTNGTAELIDPRCEELGSTSWESTWPLVGPLLTIGNKTLYNARARVFSSRAGYGWLFSVLVSGGLIGLGAPFWFKTFRFIASFVPGIKLPDSTAARQERSGQVAQAQPTAATTPSPPAAAATLGTPSTTTGQAGAATTAGAGTVAGTPAAVTAPATTGTVPDLGLTEDDLVSAFTKSER
ncbi:MAG: hypothetical protein GY769_18585 [bacterium]|nr:hypothetical protein [bacterium]